MRIGRCSTPEAVSLSRQFRFDRTPALARQRATAASAWPRLRRWESWAAISSA
jgi:hypothetical protein